MPTSRETGPPQLDEACPDSTELPTSTAVVRLMTRIAEAEGDAARQRAAAARAARDLEDARAEIAEHAKLIEALQRSSSWRVTRPIRVMIRVIRGDQTPRQVLQRLAPELATAMDRARSARRARLAERSQRERVRPIPQPAQFPLPGALATLPELSEASPTPLAARVSVIIPTLNAGHEFYWLLRKLRAQKGLSQVEIVIVDSGSTDGTVELADQFDCKLVRIQAADFSHSLARNLGADNATGDTLLFTVQDAYPIGDHWLHSLVCALRDSPEAASGLAAVSCVEFPRTDSELMYNAAIDVHSQFLGCREIDRVGRFVGADHTALRTQGQISDLACLIPAETFQRYRYEGRYAEDLVLGVRLIRDGLKVAMLSSIKVVHSHNRPAGYHLKRNFVDVTFLSEAFPDLAIPQVRTVEGAVLGASILWALTEDWRQGERRDGGRAVRNLAAWARRGLPQDQASRLFPDFGVPRLAAWMQQGRDAKPADASADAEVMRHAYAGRLEGLADFIEQTYPKVDAYLLAEIDAAVTKTLAASIGAHLAFYYLNQSRQGSQARCGVLEDLRALMLSGV